MHSPEEFTYTVQHTGTKEKPGCMKKVTLPYEKLMSWAMDHACPEKATVKVDPSAWTTSEKLSVILANKVSEHHEGDDDYPRQHLSPDEAATKLKRKREEHYPR